jgi:predicted N-acyltransferase
MSRPAPPAEAGPEAALEAHILTSLGDVGAEAWDACVPGGHPFVSHAFLSALEDSGSATPETGWLGQHVVLKDEGGTILGAVPMYLKNHSQGEYVFDHGWADAFERAGGRYYPKMQVSVPFTPATGPRLLLRADAAADAEEAAALRGALLSACIQCSDKTGASSLHITFPIEEEAQLMQEAGLLLRTGMQFHWDNHGYDSFDDFLASLASRKRKQIRRERRQALEDGLTVEALTGGDIHEHHWDAFFHFYQETGSRKWGMPYLTREFFSLLGQNMGDRVVLLIAENAGRPIAGALNLMSGDTLYGRNWGAVEYHKFLHFELCYYQAIDYAIRHRLKRVEAGAQGEHKLLRGYLPCPTYSAHWIANPSFRDAIEEYLQRETQQVDWEIEALGAHSPFRKSTP